VVMRDGQKLQEGSPEEVYNRPANHFVADFLGHSNFLPGEIVDQDEESIRIKIETGDVLLAKQRGNWKKGDNVEIVVRAQRFEVLRKEEIDPDDQMNHFKGRIKDKSYMGGEVSYFIELPSGREIHVISMMRTATYDYGDDVSVQVSPYHCHLIAAA